MSERHPPTGSVGTPPRSNGPVAVPSAPPSWDHWFPTLPPDVQNTLLRTATTRGGLIAAELPPGPPLTPYADAIERWLGRFLAADPSAFAGFEPATVGTDPRRHPSEVHALATAAVAPDLFLVDSPTGCDRITYIADLAAEAARLGQRVLVLTATPSSSDALLARWTSDPDLLVGRAVGTGLESAERLPAASLARTAAAHGSRLVAEIRAKVMASIAAAENALATLLKAEAAVPPIREAMNRLANESVEPNPVEVPDTEIERIDAQIRAFAASSTAKRLEAAALEAELAEHVKRAEVKKSGGVFSKVIGLFAKDDSADKSHEIQAKIVATTTEIDRLTAEIERYTNERAQRVEALAVERIQRVNDDAARRAVEREHSETAIREGRLAFADAGLTVPDELTPEALDGLATRSTENRARLEAELAFARGWHHDLATREPDLVREFWGQVRIVVGPFAAVDRDPFTTAVPFDRLIVADAENCADDALAAAVKLATTWVLVGEAEPLAIGSNGRNGAYALPKTGRNGQSYPQRGLAFRKLWNHFHRPVWCRDHNGLVARLTPVDPRLDLIREPLADRPDVELRFLRSAGEPQLAEVAFPPSVPAAEARAFLARELGEIRITPCGAVSWREMESQLIACWPAVDAHICDCDWADLAPGVREKVDGTGPDARTCAVVFEKDAGWDRPTAEEWLARIAPVGRTAELPRPLVVAQPVPSRLVAGAIG